MPYDICLQIHNLVTFSYKLNLLTQLSAGTGIIKNLLNFFVLWLFIYFLFYFLVPTSFWSLHLEQEYVGSQK